MIALDVLLRLLLALLLWLGPLCFLVDGGSALRELQQGRGGAEQGGVRQADRADEARSLRQFEMVVEVESKPMIPLTAKAP